MDHSSHEYESDNEFGAFYSDHGYICFSSNREFVRGLKEHHLKLKTAKKTKTTKGETESNSDATTDGEQYTKECKTRVDASEEPEK